MATIRMIAASFVRQDADALLSDAILDQRATELLALKGENRFRQMVVYAVEAGSATAWEAEADKLYDKLKAKILTDIFDGAKFADLNEAQKTRFHGFTNWFRSNRSVIKRAYETGVDILDGDNVPKGKSQIANEITAVTKGDADEEKNPLIQFTKRLASAQVALDKIEDDDDWHSALKLISDMLAKAKAGDEG